MDCDFYECADLIDDLKTLKMRHDEDLLRAERLIGTKDVHVMLVYWNLQLLV